MSEPSDVREVTRRESSPGADGGETVSFEVKEGSTLRLPQTNPLPAQFADYELLDEIARGGMGVVYRARQVKLNRVVALKMILGGQFADSDSHRRFQIEAEAAARLDHPGIVPIYEIGSVEGRQFFSMGYVDGPSLAVQLRDGPLPNHTAAELVHDLAEALEYAHQQGVIHRDLKPSNVLLAKEVFGKGTSTLDPSGSSANRSSVSERSAPRFQPRITDFGLAKLLQSDGELTTTGQVMGTPAYMPPEQAAGRGDQIGPRSDVYSLGAVLYCTLTGRPPFQAAQVVETLQQVQHLEPVPPRQLNPAVNHDLETICLKCLEKAPGRRYATAADLAGDLARFLRGEPILARPTSALERAGKWARRRPTLAGLMAVSALALILVAALSVGAYYHTALQAEKRSADMQRDHAVHARSAAERARGELAVEKRKVERQRDIIQEQKAEVERQKKQVEQQKVFVEIERDRTRRFQYSSDLNMADRAWHDSHVGEMLSILNRNVPRPHDQELRGWEWYYLWQQAYWNSAHLTGSRGTRYMTHAPLASRLAVTGVGASVDIWDLKPFSMKLTISVEHLPDQGLTPNDTADGVALTTDGKTLAIGFHNGRLVAWDCEKSQMIFGVQTTTGPWPYVSAVDVTADGQTFVAGDSSGGLRLWDRQGTLLRELPIAADNVTFARFSPDGRRVAATHSDHSLRVFDTSTGELQTTLRGHTLYASSIAWSADGTLIAGGAYNEEARIWDVASGEVRHVLRGHRGAVNDAAFRPNGQVVATCGADGTVCLWNVATGVLERRLRGHSQFIYSVAWTSDGSGLITSSADNSTRFWDLSQAPEFRIVDAVTPLMNTEVALSSDGKQFAVIQRDGVVVVRNAVSGEATHRLGQPTPGQSRATMQFHPDNQRLGVCSSDGSVRIWTPASGEGRDLTRHALAVYDLAFSPDGTRLATACEDRIARILDVETGEFLTRMEGHENGVWALDWSPDGQWIATGGHDGRLILWNAETGERVRQWPIMNFPHGMTFSPDSTLIAVPAAYGADLHEVATGKVVLSLRGHTDGLGGIAFSPDQRRIFTSSWDRTVKVFDAVTGQPTLTLPSKDKVNAIALDRTGSRLVGIGDHTTTVWFAPVPAPRTARTPVSGVSPPP